MDRPLVYQEERGGRERERERGGRGGGRGGGREGEREGGREGGGEREREGREGGGGGWRDKYHALDTSSLQRTQQIRKSFQQWWDQQ